MVSQDLIYSVLPRPTAQVEHKNRIVEQVVKRSSLKSIDEKESSQSEPVVVARKERRGDRRRSDRRQGDRRNVARTDPGATTTSAQIPTPKSSSDDQQSTGLDIFV